MEAMKRFCIAVRVEFGDEYLRQPTGDDFEKQLAINANRGWPGMFALNPKAPRVFLGRNCEKLPLFRVVRKKL